MADFAATCGSCPDPCCIGSLSIFLDDEDRTRTGLRTRWFRIAEDRRCRHLGEAGCRFGAEKPFMCAIYPVVVSRLSGERAHLALHGPCLLQERLRGQEHPHLAHVRQLVKEKLRTAEGRRLLARIARYYRGEELLALGSVCRKKDVS